MASISFLRSPNQTFDPFFRPQIIINKPSPNKSARAWPVRAAHDRDFLNGRLVDEGLIVLRKRIHETKMTERNYEPPKDWMEWEKQIYTGYNSTICEAMGYLQSCLMETRPCLALGMVALVALSVPTSIAAIVYNLFGLIRGVLVGI